MRERESVYIDIYLPVPSWHPFTYSATSAELPKQPVGCRVIVPLRGRHVVGFIAGKGSPGSGTEIRPIEHVVDERPWLDESLWKIGLWISKYYFCPPGIALSSLLPGPVRSKIVRYILRTEEKTSQSEVDLPVTAKAILAMLKTDHPVSERAFLRTMSKQDVDQGISWLVDNELVEVSHKSAKKAGRLVEFAVLNSDTVPIDSLTSAGKRVIQVLRERGGILPVAKLIEYAKTSRSPVRTLEQNGLITIRREYAFLPSAPSLTLNQPGLRPELTEYQRSACQAIETAIEREIHTSFLLFGVTGSGKTEVYLRSVESVIHHGKGVICLVPEIALTAQMVALFRGRFHDDVVVIHSALGDAERADAWRTIRSKSTPVVIGPRSAVFAPVQQLGLIVVDEEHEASYKQSHSPRYHARDVALMRAALSSCPAILGSATPSLESFEKAYSGKYSLLTMDERIDARPLPEITMVDMTKEHRDRTYFDLSDVMRRRITRTVKKKQQAILFLNRRGFSRTVQCSDCGFLPKCPSCDIALTFHRSKGWLACHYCDYRERAPERCPQCSSHKISYGSSGTERIEQQLEALLPDATVVRMDRDTTRSRGSHIELLQKMVAHEADILIGTQMVAKGLDIHNVTLVGVINADTPLYLPDFRSNERAFQLLTQVAGRAGRGTTGGEVIFQSHLVDYPAILHASRHDYRTFAMEELTMRKTLGYPPFSNCARIECSAAREDDVQRHAQTLTSSLRRLKPEGAARILGPAPPLFPKLRGKFRRHILLFHSSRNVLHTWIRGILKGRKPVAQASGVRVVIDVDPLETF